MTAENPRTDDQATPGARAGISRALDAPMLAANLARARLAERANEDDHARALTALAAAHLARLAASDAERLAMFRARAAGCTLDGIAAAMGTSRREIGRKLKGPNPIPNKERTP